MRVITGKYKGRSLVAPKNLTRPTLDRMKETLFNIIGTNLQGATMLDLFAGSGQIAIECLSRGAKRVILCDNSKDAIAAIKLNFAKIGETPDIMFGDFRDCLRSLNVKMDFIFVDPPYQSGYYLEVLDLIYKYNVLNKEGIVVCEHAADDILPQNVNYLSCYDIRKIGTVKFR